MTAEPSTSRAELTTAEPDTKPPADVPHTSGIARATPQDLRRAEWVSGRGPLAVLAWCPPLTVTRYADEADARAALDFIDRFGCGGGCTRRHELARLEVAP